MAFVRTLIRTDEPRRKPLAVLPVSERRQALAGIGNARKVRRVAGALAAALLANAVPLGAAAARAEAVAGRSAVVERAVTEVPGPAAATPTKRANNGTVAKLPSTAGTLPGQQRSTLANAVIEFRQARFKVEAIGFIAVDETGPDWLASDEVNSFFYTRQSQPRLAVPREVGNVDKGDEEHYGERERCILPRRVIRNVGASKVLQAPDDAWDCRTGGVAGPIEFTVTMYEGDSYSFHRFPWCFSGPAAPGGEVEGKDCQDDLIGKETVSFTRGQLVDKMPRVDNTFVGTVTLGGPCGPGNDACGGWGPRGPEYRFGYRITRLADRIMKTPPAAPVE